MKQIPLTHGLFALVDDADYEELSKFTWSATLACDSFYASRTETADHKGQTVLMHRQVMETEAGFDTDHRNGNRLDNQRHNLRSCTTSQNLHNSKLSRRNKSGYKGVSWNKKSKKWQAYISVNGKRLHLGMFFCLIKAAKTYDKTAKEHFGEFARLNFPE